MSLPVVTDCFQVKFIWTSSAAQRPATNTLHVNDLGAGKTPLQIFNFIDGDVTANMWELVSSTAAVQSVEITPLDGSSATQSFATGAPAKWSGSGGSDPILQGSIVVTERTNTRGISHRGRIFLPFCGETGQAGGTLTPANVANMQTGWTAFLAAMIADLVPLTVVSPLLSTDTLASSLVVRPYLKTQRRRSRR